MNVIEFFSAIVLYWFPYYYTIKVVVILYLMLPQFRGAETVYKHFLRYLLVN